MIRFLLRFAGLLSLALGFIFLVYDGTKSIADQHWHISRVGDMVSLIRDGTPIKPSSIPDGTTAWLWDPFLVNLINEPTWLVLLVLGMILTLLGRKKRPLIGYAR